MVTVPVKLYSAIEQHDVHFRLLSGRRSLRPGGSAPPPEGLCLEVLLAIREVITSYQRFAGARPPSLGIRHVGLLVRIGGLIGFAGHERSVVLLEREVTGGAGQSAATGGEVAVAHR